jgi:hypothetical protein
VRPARALDRLGFPAAAARARLLRSDAAYVASGLRPSWALQKTREWLREPLGRRAYRTLSEEELLATRSAETAFVFGSGRSLLDIGPDEWRRIGEANTIGFSHFHRQRWVRVDYHLVAEVSGVRPTAESIAASPCYASTIFLVMRGWNAEASNALVGRRLLPRGARVYRYRRIARGLTIPPSERLGAGLVHGSNTSLDVVNFALAMGWRRVVVAGVDLYNRNYFFLGEDETRPDERPGWSANMRFHQADHVVEMFGLWHGAARERGIELYVYDSRSLLAEVLPVFSWSDE